MDLEAIFQIEWVQYALSLGAIFIIFYIWGTYIRPYLRKEYGFFWTQEEIDQNWLRIQQERKQEWERPLINESLKALTFSTYELTEIAISVVDQYNYDELKEVASVIVEASLLDNVLYEESKRLSSQYKSAIIEISKTRCRNSVSRYLEKEEAAARLRSLVNSCISLGRGAIGKKIGLSASPRNGSSSKEEIRKTKKWVE